MEEDRNAVKVFTGKPKENRHLGMRNIGMDLEEIGLQYEELGWFGSA